MMDVLNWAAEHYLLAPLLLWIIMGGCGRFLTAMWVVANRK